jgi:hypothetical protein
MSQAIIALEIGYLKTGVFEHIKGECQAIFRMLGRLIADRSKTTKTGP